MALSIGVGGSATRAVAGREVRVELGRVLLANAMNRSSRTRRALEIA